MNAIQEYLNYPRPKPGVRDEYKYETSQSHTGWDQYDVTVLRRVSTSAHPSQEIWEEIGSYHRNYSMMKTFEPFRQLQDGVWKDYALISQDYSALDVMDLSTGEIIASEKPFVITKEMAESSNGRWVEGEEKPGWGFCPMEFFIPDWYDVFPGNYLGPNPETALKNQTEEQQLETAKKYLDYFTVATGHWGVYIGCAWGDDASDKLQYVDLSRISEGIVTTDNRFGYVEVEHSWSTKLSENIHVSPSTKRISVPVTVNFDVTTGKAQHKENFLEGINWDETNTSKAEDDDAD